MGGVEGAGATGVVVAALAETGAAFVLVSMVFMIGKPLDSRTGLARRWIDETLGCGRKSRTRVASRMARVRSPVSSDRRSTRHGS
jgi:hypothetical protein